MRSLSPLTNPAKVSGISEKEQSSLKILLAEDNAVNQKLARLLFRKLGYEVSIASSGTEAVERTLNEDFDLIFMDVMMPQMDGMEATRLLREQLGEKCPRIIALTAHTLDGERERIMESGMDDYLAKPIDLQKLQELINKHGSPV